MTTTEHTVAAALDETIAALSALDIERLLWLEERMLQLAKSGLTGSSMPSLLERQKLLGSVLEATQSNLAGLAQLHERNGADAWAR